MMQVKRTTYASMVANDEVAKLSPDIKKVIQHLQEEIKKGKTVNEYAKLIQSLKREYQAVSAEKNKLQDFFKKQEKEKQKVEQKSLMKQHAKQIDLYNKMLAVQKRRQKKRKIYYNYERDSNDYEGSVENDVYEKKKKKYIQKIKRR